MTTFVDDFNRADSSNLGAGWVEVSGDWSISSNQLSSGNAGGTVLLRAAGAMATDDNSAQVTVAATAAVSQGVWCRGDNNLQNGYLWRNDGTSWNLFSVVGGSFSSIASFAAAAVNGDVMKVQAIGTAIKAFVNGVQRASVTDSSVVTGKTVGIRAESTNSLRFDDFTGADAGGTTVSATLDGTGGAHSGTLTAVREVLSTLAGAGGAHTGALAAAREVPAALAGVAGAHAGALVGQRERVAVLAGLSGAHSGQLTADGGTAAQEHPSSLTVMLAWIKQVAGLSNAAMTLPAIAGWFDTGFITVPTVVGGNPDVDIPLRKPVIQVDTWAANRAASGSTAVARKAPYAKANNLADRVVLATYPTPVPPVVLPDFYLPVWIESIKAVSEVRKVPEPDQSIAHFSVDIELHWIERTPVI